MNKNNCRQAKCKDCEQYWSVSNMAKIPFYGYKCPRCRAVRKEDINDKKMLDMR